MADLRETGAWLEEALPVLLEEHRVPGAVVGLVHDAERFTAAAGVLHLGTGTPVRTDSLFQIGSITKVWTATLVMQLVAEGRVALDDEIRRYLPGFHTSDESACALITIRQLLSHTSGFEGDVFTDTGKGADCIARYADQLAGVPQLFPPGEMFSYNNAGFCLLGRVIEIVDGRTYDESLRARLLAPLRLERVARDPYEAVLHSTAVGHLPTGADGVLEPAKVWALARSNAPAGSMLAMSVDELLTFVRAHLDDDERVLPPAITELMREQRVTQPDLLQGSGWGLGWERFDQPGASVFGHDGNTIGQSAFLRILPDHGVVLALLTNGGGGKGLFERLARKVYDDLAGIALPERPIPDPGARVDRPERLCGRYRSASEETTVSVDPDGRLWLDRVPIGEAAEVDEPHRTELVAWRGDSLLPLVCVSGVHAPVAFLGDDGSGRARYLHTGRAEPRIPDDAPEVTR